MKRRSAFPFLLALAAAACGSQPERLEGFDRVAIEDVMAAVDRERLMGVLGELVDAHRGDRPVDCSGAPPYATADSPCVYTRSEARALVERKLGELGLHVERQESESDGLPVVNIWAEVRGERFPDEVVLVGAHYDAFFAAADDNTSGMAGVLELARVLSARRFDRTVRFVAFDREEQGLVGSVRYTKAIASGERIRAALILEMIGYRDFTPGSQGPMGAFTPERGDFLDVNVNDASIRLATDVWQLNAELDVLPLFILVAPADGAFPLMGDFIRSDHAPFWLAGKPAILFSDSGENRNPYYHTPRDAPESLDPDFFRDVVRLSAAAMSYWAGSCG